MKKLLLTATVFLLTLALLAGCSKRLPAQLADDEPSESTTEPATIPSTEMTPTEPEDDTQYEGDASSYYIDVVYAQQIERYYTAISQQWDENTYMEHEMSSLAAYYYDGKPLDNVGFALMDLDGDGIWELIIGAIHNAQRDPLVFEIWGLKNDEPVMLAQSGSHNRYYLQYAEEDELWSVAYEAENGAANRAVYDLQLSNGEFKVVRGVVFDALANEEAPWFMTYDLDWDTSNDTPIDEQTATSFMDASRNLYQAAECFPYNLYK
jgi:hypothetical protein